MNRAKAISIRLVVWLVFGVILALLPLMMAAVRIFFSEEGFSQLTLFGSGELFIIAAVVSTAACGEVIEALIKHSSGASTVWILLLIAAAGCAFGIGLVCAGAYMLHSSNDEKVMQLSFWAFDVTVISSGVAVGMAAARS